MLSERLARLAEARPAFAPRAFGRVTGASGALAEASGLAVPVGGLVRVRRPGRAVPAEVIGFRGESTTLMLLEPAADLALGDEVEAAGEGATVPAGAALLGRVVDGLGQPLDGGPPVRSAVRWPLAGRPGNPLDRARVTDALPTGVRAIDALATLGMGQRVGIMAGSGVGKSVLLGMIAEQAACDVLVIGLIGERAREVSDFVETKLPPAVRARAAVVAVPGDHAPVLRIRGAMRALAIAESLRAEGRRVLLMMDSLTRVAHAAREVALAMGEPASARGYPPSALGLIPRLVERGGACRRSGGSITAIFTVLADGDDGDDPVVDAARSILDGHIVLSRAQAERGVYPAIDLGASLSRVMADVVTPHHRESARRVRALSTTFHENRDLILMGAYKSGTDAELDRAVALQPIVRALVTQAPDERCDFADAVAALHATAAD